MTATTKRLSILAGAALAGSMLADGACAQDVKVPHTSWMPLKVTAQSAPPP